MVPRRCGNTAAGPGAAARSHPVPHPRTDARTRTTDEHTRRRELMSTATSKVRTALVIGGGIAGPVAATALLKAGVQATVYEAYPTLAEGIGGGLALAANR